MQKPEFIAAARRNLDWALTRQTASGWFATNAFVPERPPFTHTIAYAIRGFIEVGGLLGEQRYLQAAEAAARGIMAVQREDGWLAGTYSDGWTAQAGYACVTGVAQAGTALGAFSTSTRHMRQLAAMESFLW